MKLNVYLSVPMLYRQHFAMQCYKNMWTETVAELHCLSSDRLVPEQVGHTGDSNLIPSPLSRREEEEAHPRKRSHPTVISMLARSYLSCFPCRVR